MNFNKQFDDDFVFCGKINLPWDRVAYDLEQVVKDTTCSKSILEDTGYQDALSKITQEYKQHGYTEYNTKIWKTTNVNPKMTFDWEQTIIDQLPLNHAIATVTRLDPGQVLPWHIDRFFMLSRLYPNETRPVWRFLLFLEDWQMGHVLQVKDTMLHHWKQGDVVVWHPGTMHVAANIGIEPKWTCNITGFLNT